MSRSIERTLLVAALLSALAAPALLGADASGAGSRSGGVARTDAAGTTWLCRPGLASNPCAGTLDSTAVQADGSTTVTAAEPVASSKFDCFYVYPTVSAEQTANSDLKIQKEEIAAATAQAARFSALCDVWAPMYRQSTKQTLSKGFPFPKQSVQIAYTSLLAGWKDYLANHNRGRPIVFLAHSQGSNLLMQLLSEQVETNAALLRRVVSAILPGGNVEVPSVSGGAGTFRRIPPCRSTGQTGCVIAYSTFPGQPPSDALLGRPGQGPSKGLPGQSPTTTQVVCVNPAALGGGTASLDTFYPAALQPTPGVTVTTAWVEYPGLYTATCKSTAGATWLEVTPALPAGSDVRPRVSAALPQIGFHSADVNLALGDLVRDVQAQERAYTAAHP